VASAVKGVAWTAEQQESLQAATKRVAEDREAFIKVARKELGEEPVILPLGQQDGEGLSGNQLPECDQPAGNTRLSTS
jgi:hypothetical protein